MLLDIAKVALLVGLIGLSLEGCKECVVVPCPSGGFDTQSCRCLGAADAGSDAPDAGD